MAEIFLNIYEEYIPSLFLCATHAFVTCQPAYISRLIFIGIIYLIKNIHPPYTYTYTCIYNIHKRKDIFILRRHRRRHRREISSSIFPNIYLFFHVCTHRTRRIKGNDPVFGAATRPAVTNPRTHLFLLILESSFGNQHKTQWSGTMCCAVLNFKAHHYIRRARMHLCEKDKMWHL